MSQVASPETLAGDRYTPSGVDGPRLERILSNTIEVQIDEVAPENAEEEAAFRILETIGDEYIYAITETGSLDDEGILDNHTTGGGEVNKSKDRIRTVIHK